MTSTQLFRLALLFMAIVVVASSCRDKDDEPLPYDQETILLPIGQDLAVRNHLDFRDFTMNLVNDCQAFVNTVNAQNLMELQQQLKQTHLAWKACEPYEFGQAQNTYLHNRIGKWPSNYNFIELGISDSIPITAASVEGLGSTSRGLSAIEYLLFDQDSPQTLMAFSSGPFAARRSQYLELLCLNLHEKATALYNHWQPAGSNFGCAWPKSTETGIQSALSLFVNRQIELIEEITKQKLGTPMGKFDGGAAQPESLEAGRSENSLPLIRKNLEAIHALAKGPSQESGLYAALDALDARYNGGSLSAAIENNFQELFLRIDAIAGSMVATLLSAPNSLDPIYESARKLTVLFKTDVASALSITVTVSDNDGD